MQLLTSLLVQDAESATHIIIGDKHEGLHDLTFPKEAHVVTSEWLETCLSNQKRLPERDFRANLKELSSKANGKPSSPAV